MRLLLRRGTSEYVEADDALSITDSLACEAGLSPFRLLPDHPSFSPGFLEHVPYSWRGHFWTRCADGSLCGAFERERREDDD